MDSDGYPRSARERSGRKYSSKSKGMQTDQETNNVGCVGPVDTHSISIDVESELRQQLASLRGRVAALEVYAWSYDCV